LLVLSNILHRMRYQHICKIEFYPQRSPTSNNLYWAIFLNKLIVNIDDIFSYFVLKELTPIYFHGSKKNKKFLPKIHKREIFIMDKLICMCVVCEDYILLQKKWKNADVSKKQGQRYFKNYFSSYFSCFYYICLGVSFFGNFLS